MLLQGIVDKNIVGTSGGSIVHVTWLEKGWEETRSFMNQVQTVVNYWMVNVSYSVGVSDTVADATTINTIQATLDEAKKKVIPLLSHYDVHLLLLYLPYILYLLEHTCFSNIRPPSFHYCCHYLSIDFLLSTLRFCLLFSLLLLLLWFL